MRSGTTPRIAERTFSSRTQSPQRPNRPSDPIAPAKYSFFHLKSHQFEWDRFEDLADLRVGGTSEYSYGREFDAAEEAGVFQTHRAISDEVGLTNLLKGRIDVFPGELMVTYEQIRDTFSQGEAALFTHHPRHINQAPIHLILSKKVPNNEQMRDLFNEGLRQLKESGQYDQIIADGLAGKCRWSSWQVWRPGVSNWAWN